MEVIKSVLWEEDSCCTVDQFSRAIDLLISRPHIVNKRLAGSIPVSRVQLSLDLKNLLSTEKYHEINLNTVSKPETANGNDATYDLTESCVLGSKLIVKNSPDEVEWVVWYRGGQNDASVAFLKENYVIQLKQNCLRLWVPTERSDRWTCWITNVFEKVTKWCGESIDTSNASLKLVPLDQYSELYGQLKAKYYHKLAQEWRKTESTDPEKFLHEDIGIATYLLLIWNDRPKSFVDLGCGNGLLVHILSQEGVRGGVGIDLRPRKVWQYFQSQGTDLRVSTIVPRADDTFKDYDWLIGNHSDELTPWIPIMAHLCGSKFFVLPCCPFQLYKKFQRTQTKLSAYRDYLNYVSQLGNKCGFDMEEDKLRIPSTKRICFVGRQLLQKSCVVNITNVLDSEQGQFLARPTEETVRNCTQVDKTVVQDIVDIVVKVLLTKKRLVDSSSEVLLHPLAVPDWNAGGVVTMADLSTSLLPANHLTKLKNECGGLQTLLRNHNHIFVVGKGTVRLRCPATDSHHVGKRKVNQNIQEFKKKKLCWFHENHPQGCPIKPDNCMWAHGQTDLKL